MRWAYSSNVHESSTVKYVANDFMNALHGIVAHTRTMETDVIAPTDFPMASLPQSDLDSLMSQLEAEKRAEQSNEPANC